MSLPEYHTNPGGEVAFNIGGGCHTADVMASCLRKISTLNRLFAIEVVDVAWGRPFSPSPTRSCR